MVGPSTFLIAPESYEFNEDLKQIPSLMDLYEQGFFIHMFGSVKSANHIFEIPSEYARGRRELLLISIVIDINSNINFDLMKELLEGFEKEFKKIQDAYKGLYVDEKNFEDNRNKLEEIRNLFYNFYETLPTENLIYDRKDAKILVFGLFQAGKTTIINCLKKTITQNNLPTTHIDISRILLNNLSLYIYDTPGQLKYRNLWKPYLKNQDGLVFVLDIADKEKYDSARDTLHKIIDIPELSDIPLLIIFNKTDLLQPEINDFSNIIGIKELGDRNFKCFYTCGITGKNVDDAFNWLTSKISDRIFPSPKRELGIILSKWDENIGCKIIDVYPNDIFNDPEAIAIRCFSVSQFIFGGENVKRISVLLPFTHLKVKAAIYFDYIYDENIRGGKLPLSLVLFYKENIPREIIDQFNIYIFEKFTQIKESYTKQTAIRKVLREIQETILKRLRSFKSTVQALRIAELRYQALFKAARDAILIIDRKTGIIVDANEQVEKLLQHPLEDIIGLHSSQLELDEYNQNFKDQIFMQIELENSPPIEIQFKDLNGNAIPVEVNANEIQMGTQNLIQCVIRDITERKRAEKELRTSENRYRHLFKNSPFSIFLINYKGIIVDSNPAIYQLFGYEKEELIGKEFSKLSIIEPKYLLLVRESLRNVKIGDSLTFLDIKMEKKDKSFIWANINASLIKIESESFIQIIAKDITEQKEAELARKRAIEDLRESEARYHIAYDQANFYKELFTNDIKDVFRNIQLSFENLPDYQENHEKINNFNNFLKTIKEQISKGTKLVANVRKLSEIEESKRFIKSIEGNKILNEAINTVRSSFQEKNIDIKVKSSYNRFYIKANDMLFDVFENILINAVQYNENPVINVEIKISKEKKNNMNYLKMEFIDNGIGISDDKKESIFESGDKKKRDVGGVLLGLILADQILKSFNGYTWIEDRVKGDYTKGSNFIILIPESVK